MRSAAFMQKDGDSALNDPSALWLTVPPSCGKQNRFTSQTSNQDIDNVEHNREQSLCVLAWGITVNKAQKQLQQEKLTIFCKLKC